MARDADGWLRPVGEEVAVLWTLRGATDALVRCTVVSHALGLELRGYRGDEFMRSEVFREYPALLERARKWRAALEAKGWTEIAPALGAQRREWSTLTRSPITSRPCGDALAAPVARD